MPMLLGSLYPFAFGNLFISNFLKFKDILIKKNNIKFYLLNNSEKYINLKN